MLIRPGRRQRRIKASPSLFGVCGCAGQVCTRKKGRKGRSWAKSVAQHEASAFGQPALFRLSMQLARALEETVPVMVACTDPHCPSKL